MPCKRRKCHRGMCHTGKCHRRKFHSGKCHRGMFHRVKCQKKCHRESAIGESVKENVPWHRKKCHRGKCRAIGKSDIGESVVR